MKTLARKLLIAAVLPTPVLASASPEHEAHRWLWDSSHFDFWLSTIGTFAISMLASALVFRFAFYRR